MAQAAKALAALAGRKKVTGEDVKEVAPLVLPHRMTDLPAEAQEERAGEMEASSREKEKEKQKQERNDHPEENRPARENEAEGSGERKERKTLPEEARELVFSIGETFRVKSIKPPQDRILRKGSGRRALTRTQEKRGRYLGSTYPKGEENCRDIALDATLRAAAPYQLERRKAGGGLCIEKSDIRTKIRKKSMGTSILFVVDASGSMGAQERMVAVKGAVLSLLADAYQQRDKVGLVAFRRDAAELLLPLTKSVELAQKRMAELPTGGKTPLAEGLALGYQILLNELGKDPNRVPLMVIVTDGRANMCLEGSEPFQAALEAARKIQASPVVSIVLDTENSFISLGLARRLCEALSGQYYKIDDLKAELLAAKVSSAGKWRKEHESYDYLGGDLSP